MQSATLTWTANTETNLSGYKVYRGLGALPQAVLVSLGKVTTYLDATVPDVSQDVSYSLTAMNTSGVESAHSATVTKAVIANPPAAPVGLTVVLG